ncbi:MAG: hypothetical protein A2Z12_07735 [Actinobacteria bacterium RBG_16_68_21]|nr:MAG: hypothetical protein A2Z12_07735 [Actinobacteria bacterium RBG_16_68_21]
MNRALRTTALLATAYVAAQMLADISSLKITEIAGLSMDAGTLVYPFTFTLRDLVHRVAGVHVARTLIVAAAVINLAMAGLFWIVDKLPAVPGVGPQTDQFGAVLAPVWRIVFASILAEVVSELIDTEVYRAWAHRFGERRLWGRVLVSNAVSIPTDTLLFVLVAFYGVVPGGDVWEIVTTNVLVKGAITLISIPWIYWVRRGREGDSQSPDRSSQSRI